MYNCYIRMRNRLLSIYVATSVIVCVMNIGPAFSQDNIENWNMYADPGGRFTVFYPSELQAEGKENFLSSVDLTLRNPNFAREFKITIMYNHEDPSLLDYTQGLEISPQNYLLALENQLKPSYQDYNLLDEPSNSNDVYGFPTVSNTLDFTNHLGESGRTLNVLAVINGQGSFLFSYSNSVESFYEYLPTVNQIIKSVVVLK
jgi:hypothetical protein